MRDLWIVLVVLGYPLLYLGLGGQWLVFLGACALLHLSSELAAWAARELRLERETVRARRLGALARALADHHAPPGRLTRLGPAALLIGTWRGRPFRLLCDPRVGLIWEVVATGHAVDLLAARARVLGRLAPPRVVRGGPPHAWRQPGPGRAEALALRLLDEGRLRRVELTGELLRAEAGLSWRDLELDRLLAMLQTLAGIADLVSPRERAALPAAWREAPAAVRCPFCRDGLRRGVPTWDCPACATQHHAGCAREAGGCTVFGCRETSRRPPLRVVEK